MNANRGTDAAQCRLYTLYPVLNLFYYHEGHEGHEGHEDNEGKAI